MYADNILTKMAFKFRSYRSTGYIMYNRNNIVAFVLIVYIMCFSLFFRSKSEPEHFSQNNKLEVWEKIPTNNNRGFARGQGSMYEKRSNFQNKGPVGVKHINLDELEVHPLGSINHIKYDDDNNKIVRNPEWLSSGHLSRSLSQYQYKELIDLVEEVTKLFKRAGITFLMGGNTLAGSYIFHDLVPWHNKMELMLDYRQIDSIRTYFLTEDFQQTYGVKSIGDPVNWYSEYMLSKTDSVWLDRDLITQYEENSSFRFRLSRHKAAHNRLLWPFLDFSFFNVTTAQDGSDRVYKIDPKKRYFRHYYNDVFPVHMRPFSHLWLPAPNHPRKILSQSLDEDFECRSAHLVDTRIHDPITIDCDQLAAVYGQVHRQPIDDGLKETMIVNGQKVHTIIINEPLKGHSI